MFGCRSLQLRFRFAAGSRPLLQAIPFGRALFALWRTRKSANKRATGGEGGLRLFSRGRVFRRLLPSASPPPTLPPSSATGTGSFPSAGHRNFCPTLQLKRVEVSFDFTCWRIIIRGVVEITGRPQAKPNRSARQNFPSGFNFSRVFAPR